MTSAYKAGPVAQACAPSKTKGSIFNPDGVLEIRYEGFNYKEIRRFVKEACFVAWRVSKVQ
jgi:hypothetical protein